MTAPLNKEDVLSAMTERYADFYGQFTPLKTLGDELRGPCPLHGGTGANFAVFADGGWKCFSQCQDDGDVFDFLEKKDGLRFLDALAAVANFAGVAPASGHRLTTAPRKHPPQPKPAPLPAPPDTFLDLGIAEDLHARLMQSDTMRLWLSEHRGLTTETLTRFQIGMQKDEQGLYRVCFPVLDAEGRLLNIRRHLFAYKEGMDRTFKTLPWEKGLRGGLFPLSAIEGAADVLLVEGEADAALAYQVGFAAVSGTGGAATWKPEWSEALRGRSVTVLYDGDAPGRDGAAKVAGALSGIAAAVRVASYPEGVKDFSEWVVTGGATAEDVQRVLKASVRKTSDCKDAAPEVGSDRWETPVPFSEGRALPPFPVEALPPALAHMVSEVAASIQVPADMPALLALSVLGAAAARRCLVQIGNTHTEPLNLFVAVVMGPGGRKSAAVDAMVVPLREAEEDMMQTAAPLLASAAEERTVADKRQGYLRDTAAKEKSAEKRAELMRELSECALPGEVPAAPRLLADDVTPEKLAALCAEQGGCMALLSAEGGIFGILAGRYSDGKANLDLFLKGHAGEDVRVDRKSGPPVHIRRARLSLGLAVQPDVLASLSDTPSFRGRGLLGRFLYALPEDLAGTRMYQNRPISPAARAAYDACIQDVLALPSPIGEESDPDALHVLRMEGDALRLWAARADAVERRQADGGDLASIRDWASKLAGAVARIAGGFHLAEWAGHGRPWERPVSEEHILAAWAVGEYLIPHAQAAYGHLGADPDLALARRILKWIERTEQEAFSLRDCHRAHKGQPSAQSLRPALTLLLERGFIREAPQEATGGRPKGPTYEVNPFSWWLNSGDKRAKR